MYEIVLAQEKDIEYIYQLIVSRCKWFEEKRIKQWKMDYYPQYYNQNYFKEQVRTNHLYIMKDKNKVIGVMLLKEKDKAYWKDNKMYPR